MEAAFAFFVIMEICRVCSGLVKEHFYVATNMSWSSAYHHCRHYYKDLSSIWSQDEVDELSEAAGSEAGKIAWIGLDRHPQDWKWSNGELPVYFNWKRDKFCAFMVSDQTWIPDRCTSARTFFCYEEGAGYIYVSLWVNWYDARDICRENYTDLVTVGDTGTSGSIRSKGSTGWIGLFNDPWLWSDGGSSDYKNFVYGEPNNHNGLERCVSAGSSGWRDTYCESNLHVICCEADPSKSIDNRCQPYDEKLNWTSAQAFCRERNTDLPTVYSDLESSNLQKMANGDYWIGMLHGKKNWQWANEDPVSYTNWRARLFCAVMNSEGYWIDKVCFEEHPFACQTEAPDVGKNYTLVLESKTWVEAQQHCREQYSDLATINNDMENTALRTEAPETVPEFWIGLFSDPWKWTNGSRPTFRKWASNEPDDKRSSEGCVVMENDMWYDVPCYNMHPFFCHDYMREMVLVQEMKTWEEALEFCHTVHTDLTSLLSDKEMQLAQKKVRNAQTAYVWTGLRFLHGNWMWVNRDHLWYQRWGGEGRPQCPVPNRCGALSTVTGLWEAQPCGEKLNFLCLRQ